GHNIEGLPYPPGISVIHPGEWTERREEPRRRQHKSKRRQRRKEEERGCNHRLAIHRHATLPVVDKSGSGCIGGADLSAHSCSRSPVLFSISELSAEIGSQFRLIVTPRMLV